MGYMLRKILLAPELRAEDQAALGKQEGQWELLAGGPASTDGTWAGQPPGWGEAVGFRMFFEMRRKIV